MVEYQQEYRKLEARYCARHSRYQYSMGCEKCFEVYCTECIAGVGPCKDGKLETENVHFSVLYSVKGNYSRK